MDKRIVARWETRGNDYLELTHTAGGYSFNGNGRCGTLPTLPDDASAIAYMERPWGQGGAGPVTVLRSDRSSLKRVS